MKDINLFKLNDSIYLKKVKSKAEVSSEDICNGYLIESSEKEARRIVDSLKGSDRLIGVVGGDDAFNRRVVETLKVNYLVGAERSPLNDTLKQRDSGINHVVAKEALKKGIVFVCDMNYFNDFSEKEKAKILARIIQNVKICRKAGCGYKIASFAKDKKSVVDEKARQAFGFSVGMDSKMAKDAVRF